MKFLKILIFTILCLSIQAQEAKSQRIEIVSSGAVTVNSKDSATVTILTKNVILRNSDGLFKCDSARWWRDYDYFKAFGNVQFIGNNQMQIISDTLDYSKGLADIKGNVKLTQGNQTLNTSKLIYDTKNEIGYFKNGGTVISNDGKLESTEGKYEAKKELFRFDKNVKAITEGYNIECSSLLHYPESSIYIIPGSGKASRENEILEFGAAYIDNNSDISVFHKGARGKDSKMEFFADSLFKKDDNDLSELYGTIDKPAKWSDFSNDTMEIYSSKIIHTPELTTAGNGVHTFQNEIITYSNNLIWNSNDSIMEMWGGSTTWTEGYQVISDSVKYYFRGKDLKDSIFGIGHVNLSSEPDSNGLVNEMSGVFFYGFLNKKNLETLILSGNAGALIHPEDKSATSIQSAKIQLNFEKGSLGSIKFIKGPEGEVQQDNTDQEHLPNYENRWESQDPRIDFMSGLK